MLAEKEVVRAAQLCQVPGYATERNAIYHGAEFGRLFVVCLAYPRGWTRRPRTKRPHGGLYSVRRREPCAPGQRCSNSIPSSTVTLTLWPQLNPSKSNSHQAEFREELDLFMPLQSCSIRPSLRVCTISYTWTNFDHKIL